MHHLPSCGVAHSCFGLLSRLPSEAPAQDAVAATHASAANRADAAPALPSTHYSRFKMQLQPTVSLRWHSIQECGLMQSALPGSHAITQSAYRRMASTSERPADSSADTPRPRSECLRLVRWGQHSHVRRGQARAAASRSSCTNDPHPQRGQRVASPVPPQHARVNAINRLPI